MSKENSPKMFSRGLVIGTALGALMGALGLTGAENTLGYNPVAKIFEKFDQAKAQAQKEPTDPVHK